jgi:hypothetical protein
MNEFLLFIISLAFLHVLGKGDLLNPATVYCSIVFCSAWVFYSSAILDYRPQIYNTVAMFSSNYSEVSTQVLMFHIVQAVIAIAAFTVARSDSAHDSAASPFRHRIINSAVLERVDRNLQGGAASIAICGALLLLLIGSATHLFVFTPSSFWEYSGYLRTRSPETAGITNPLIGIFHRALPQLGLVLSVATAYFYVRKHLLLMCLSILPTFYCMAFSASLGSRSLSAQIAAAGLVLIATDRGHRALGAAFFAASAVIYKGLIYLRGNAGGNGHYGLGPLLRTYSDESFYREEGSLFFVFNIFSGGCNFAHAVSHSPQNFPLSYKIHSFFPGPSFLDGFQEIREHVNIQISPVNPYGGFSEVYLFGIGWLIGYLIFLFFVLCGLCRFWERYRGTLGVMILSAAYVNFVFSPSYPIRNSFRLILLSCVLAFIVSRFMKAASPSLRFLRSSSVSQVDD